MRLESSDLTALLAALEPQLPEWFALQRWFSRGVEGAVCSAQVVDHELLREEWPQLLWTVIEVQGGAEDVAANAGGTYQVPIGLRPADDLGATLLGHQHARIGAVSVAGQELVAYDALVDPVLGRALFDVISGGRQSVQTVRPIGAEQSNTSLVFDNRLICKVFRRLYRGVNPDLDVTQRLADAGYRHVAPIVETWRRDGYDLAVAQAYLWDGTEGWKMAVGSVRDLMGRDTTGGSQTSGGSSVPIDTTDPAAAGGDFSAEARRLGEVTAELHIALAEAYPTSLFDVSGLASSLEASAPSIDDDLREPLLTRAAELQAIGEAGRAGRVHGDYHLGQTLRSVSGWYLFDFEGEPARPLPERTVPTSPLKDVAGMVRSFQYAAATGLFEQAAVERDALRHRADAWEQRNRRAFLDGYFSVDGVSDLLPDRETCEVVLSGFETEKAIYELAYEKAYRPDWVAIPTAALRRLLQPG